MDSNGQEDKTVSNTSSIDIEDKLKLAIFDLIPFTIWASTRDFEIVLWNRVCEEKYGFSRAFAIGKNYVELFVDELEKDDSKSDCLSIIDSDVKFRNFLAYDRAADGTTRTMLTNCFRVFDEERREFLQVEVGVSADELNLEVERQRLHSLRDLSRQRSEERIRAKDALKESLLSSVTDKLDLKLFRLEMKKSKIEDHLAGVTNDARFVSQAQKEIDKYEIDIADTKRLKRTMIRKIQAATTLEDLISLQEEIDE